MGWEPVDLGALDDRSPLLPTIFNLVYPGGRHVFSGEPESGKTLVAYAIALSEIRAGNTVMLIDLEMGRYRARDRLREMGATDEELKRLIYFDPAEPATKPMLSELILRFTPSLGIIDAAAGAYHLQGLDDINRSDVEVFVNTILGPFTDAGIATIVIDHVVKNADNRGRFSIGSERKLGSVDVHLGFRVVDPVSRGGTGRLRITTHKDRDGRLDKPYAGQLTIHSDPATHRLSWELSRDEGDAERPAFEPTIYMERVSAFLEAQSGPVSRGRVEKGVKGKASLIRLAIDRLIAAGNVEAREGGAGRSHELRLVRPYRSETSSSSEARPDPVPDELVGPRPSSPSFQGDEDGLTQSSDDTALDTTI